MNQSVCSDCTRVLFDADEGGGSAEGNRKIVQMQLSGQ